MNSSNCMSNITGYSLTFTDSGLKHSGYVSIKIISKLHHTAIGMFLVKIVPF